MNEDPLDSLDHRAWALWAKSGSDAGWLSLPQHMHDSAEVARALWQTWASPQLRRAITRSTQLNDDDACTLFVWLAFVHDIGKASRQFAGQLEGTGKGGDFVTRIRMAGLPMSVSPYETMRLPHGAWSRELVLRWLNREFELPSGVPSQIAAIVDAHHGLPSPQSVRGGIELAIGLYERQWVTTWQDLLAHAATTTGVRPVLNRLGKLDDGFPVDAQMLLTGLVIMADWIASDERSFPMMQHAAHIDQAERTALGLEGIDLTISWRPLFADDDDVATTMRDRFGWPTDAQPRPVQSAVADVCRGLKGPSLIIIEAPTGEGKTEAALLAAELRAAAEGSGGIFFGAPTMATSDALFRRIVVWARRAVREGDVASLFLGHSRASLNDEFRGLPRSEIGRDGDGNDRIIASQWLSGRKRGLLANMVVGTVDQLLVMALQAKHSMLRHVAFAGKVVVIDEVHAYDAYMNEYLSTALRWLARYGVTVVLLSATLPTGVKRRLIDAYAPSSAAVTESLSTSYPLITTVSAEAFDEHAVEARPPDAHVAVRMIDDGVDDVVAEVAAATVDGGCVLVLCNSVIRAQAVLDALSPALLDDTVLLHARFIAADRLERERQLTAELGPRARPGAGRPHRRIIVATQVAEQSLDIDVDLLITDIAPMDLVLQRMGRLHRHARPDADRPVVLRAPTMLVRGVADRSSPVPVFDVHATGIYGDRALLATYHLLKEHGEPGGIVRPDDVPRLVQAAYDDGLWVPDAWSDAWVAAGAERDRERARSIDRSKSFRIPPPTEVQEIHGLFANQSSDVAKNERSEEAGFAQVRDTDPSIEAVLIVTARGGYRPLPWLGEQGDTTYFDEAEPSREVVKLLARSGVRLPRRIAKHKFDEAIKVLEQQTPIAWRSHPTLRGLVALRLDENLSAELCGVRLRYDVELGLTEVRP